MEFILDLVRSQLEKQKPNAEIQLQLTKICETEDALLGDLSKEKRNKYFDLQIEVGYLTNLEIDQAIIETYKICKKLLC